jgi:hypothetical protein
MRLIPTRSRNYIKIVSDSKRIEVCLITDKGLRNLYLNKMIKVPFSLRDFDNKYLVWYADGYLYSEAERIAKQLGKILNSLN